MSAVIVTTEEQLEAIVDRAVRRALAVRDEPTEWLDARGAAALIDVHVRTVQKLVTRQGLPAHRVGTKLYRFRRSEVERWMLDEGRATPRRRGA